MCLVLVSVSSFLSHISPELKKMTYNIYTHKSTLTYSAPAKSRENLTCPEQQCVNEQESAGPVGLKG